jgi:hypothetical protein
MLRASVSDDAAVELDSVLYLINEPAGL